MEKKKLVFSLIVLGVVIFVSECIFIVCNRPALLRKVYIGLIKIQAKSNSFQNKLKYLKNINRLTIKEMDNYYPNIDLTLGLELPEKIENKDLELKYESFFRENDLLDFCDNNEKLASLFYKMGLMAYEHDEKDLIESFWRISSRLAPEWSWFSTELANFYLHEDKKVEAKKTLEFCLKFKYAGKACENYMENSFNKGLLKPVGYEKEKIKKL